ncbi:MAG: SURF1 family protein [Parvibaculum sp.]
MLILSDNPYFRPAPWPSVFVLLSLPILLWLGTWQLQRLEWKLGVIAKLEERLNTDPVPLGREALADDDEYRRFQIRGAFTPGVEFHWLTTSDEFGIGYLVFAPFKLDDGRFVIVNRGFVPQALKDKAEARKAPPDRINVRARVPEVPGRLDAANDEAANIWFTRDTVRMAALTGETPFLPLYFEEEAGEEGQTEPQAWPKPGASHVTIVNNHLDYALTWYGLGLVLVVIYFAFHLSQGRIGRKSQKQADRA